MKKQHPFEPIIHKHSKTLLIGSLPPETAPFYFSNSSKTRLWDLLYAIENKSNLVGKGMYLSDKSTKIKILKGLGLSITDIIYEYDREDMNSGEDEKILPLTYKNIIELIEDTEITKLIFLYKSAAIWFLHSLSNNIPLPIRKIKYKIDWGEFHKFEINNRIVTCILLPNPLNRGKKAGETLEVKLQDYKKHIKL